VLTDPIADMLTRIRNANKALHETAVMPTSRVKEEIARLLKEEGYIRDFRGLDPASFDGRGNYSLGVREQIIFPEINYDDVAAVRGLDIAITTSAADDESARALLRGLGLPFADDRREPE
jgi:ribosomal protein L5